MSLKNVDNVRVFIFQKHRRQRQSIELCPNYLQRYMYNTFNFFLWLKSNSTMQNNNNNDKKNSTTIRYKKVCVFEFVTIFFLFDFFFFFVTFNNIAIRETDRLRAGTDH